MKRIIKFEMCIIMIIIFLFHPVNLTISKAASEVNNVLYSDNNIIIKDVYVGEKGIAIDININRTVNLTACHCRINEQELTLYEIKNANEENRYILNFSKSELLMKSGEKYLSIQLIYTNGEKDELTIKLPCNIKKIVGINIPLDIEENNENCNIYLEDFWLNDGSCVIYGICKPLSEDTEYYLKGKDNMGNLIEFKMAYADSNNAFFSLNGTHLNDKADYLELQIFEKAVSGKKVLEAFQEDDDTFEDSVEEYNTPYPLGKTFKIILDNGMK